MKKGIPTSVVIEIMRTLWLLAHSLETRSKWMQRYLGVTGPQRLLLRVIGEAPGCSPGTAARMLSLNPGTVSRLVSGLQRAGLVHRSKDRSDGRRQRLFLTRGGERMNRRHGGTVEAAVRKAVVVAPRNEARLARKFILRIAEELDPQGAGSESPK